MTRRAPFMCGMRPSLFFVDIRRLSLFGRLRQKRMLQISRIGLTNWIFLHFWGGTSPSDTPCTHPTGAQILLVLHFGPPYPPVIKKILDPPLPFKRKQGSRRETSERQIDQGGGWRRHSSILVQGAKSNDSLPPPPGWVTSWIRPWACALWIQQLNLF